MKILFLCRSNVGRSQMAEAIYNYLTNSKNAKSAGVMVEETYLGVPLREKAGEVVSIIQEGIGVDVSEKTSDQLTQEMLAEFDAIISLEANKEFWPAFLKNVDDLIVWEVYDPRGRDTETKKATFREIRKKVEDFLQDKKLRE